MTYMAPPNRPQRHDAACACKPPRRSRDPLHHHATCPVRLVPDPPAASERRCKAGRLYGSQEFRCALDKTHTGDHEAYFTTTDGRRKTIGWKDPRSPMWSL